MALYHKLRPQTFADIIDQEPITTTISNQIKHNTTAHAYLFSGPRGVGKTTTARVLAKAINCRNRKDGEFEPCNNCDSCQEISASRSIDVIEIDAASHTGVDNVRENIIENAQFKPTKSRYKIFIIDEVHMLSTSAFNALLKTLEEPPAHVMFILATTELHKLPDTIISRCQRYHFKKVPYDGMKKHIETIASELGVTIDASVVDRVIAKSDGCVRDAVSLLDQILATGEKKITPEAAAHVIPLSNREGILRVIEACTTHDAASALKAIDTALEDGGNMLDFAEEIISMLRVMLVGKANASLELLTTDFDAATKQKLSSLEASLSPINILRLTDLFLRRRNEIKSSPLPGLPIEMAIIEWCMTEGEKTHVTPIPPAPTPRKAATSTPVQNAPAEIKKTTTESNSQPFNATVDALPAPSLTQPPIIEEKKTIIERVKEFVQGEAVCSDEQARSAWATASKQLALNSPSLGFILSSTKVKGVTGEVINLLAQYSLHYDTLMTNKEMQKKIENALSDVIGARVRIEVMIEPAQDVEPDNTDLQNLTAAFGGEVIG